MGLRFRDFIAAAVVRAVPGGLAVPAGVGVGDFLAEGFQLWTVPVSGLFELNRGGVAAF